ncbi:MAG: right-handed parallel beta-helix repeat-containing protein [bacterium]
MKLSKGFLVLFSLFFFFLFTPSFSHQAFAITYLDKVDITSDTTWTKAESPYVVSGYVTVKEGATLNIEPGVVVKFSLYRGFNNYGKIQALGTPADKIYFTSILNDEIDGDTNSDGGNTVPDYGSWDGLYSYSGSSYDLRNVEFSYTYECINSTNSSGNLDGVSFLHSWYGIKISDQSTLIANHLSIEDIFLKGALSIFSSSTASIDNSFFKSIHYTYGDAVSLYENSNIDLKNSFFQDLGGDFMFLNNSRALVFAVDLRDVSGDGISVYNNSKIIIENSNFENISDFDYSSFLNVSYNSSARFSSSTASNIYKGAFYVWQNSFLDIDNAKISDISIGSNGSVLLVRDNSSSTVKNSNFKNIYSDHAIGVYGGNLNMSDSILENNYGSDCALCVSDNYEGQIGKVDISNTSFLGGSFGLSVSYNSEVKISKSKIKDFIQSGILVYDDGKVFIEDSEISGNNIGIEKDVGIIEIKNSSISNNVEAGVLDWGNVYNNMKATQNYWGDASGPYNANLNAQGTGNSVVDGVEFIPWLTEDPTKETPCCSNVVFIPGLQASRLYTKGLLFENQLWEPNRNADVEKLFLDTSGASVDKNIYTRDIIERTNVGMGVLDSNVYKSFADMMDVFVNEKKINAWSALPYDWRMDLNKVVTEPIKLENGNTYNFIDEIIKMAESSKTGKVSIVTHSNGGLVAKTLIAELKKRGKENLVDNLVMVASPELGTPTAVASLLHGDEQESLKGFLVRKSTARTLAENMMGAYNLLPSTEYFKKVASPVIEFDASVDKFKNFRAIYGDTIDSASELKDFLLGKEGRAEPTDTDTTTPNVLKSSMLSLAETNHNAIDNLIMPENIKVTELAGWGVSTIRGIEYVGKEVCVPDRTGCFKVTTFDRRPLYTTEGDETVVAPSAAVGSSAYYLDMRNLNNYTGRGYIHKTILEASSTLDFVKNILLNSSSTLPEYITKEKPTTLDKKKELVLHSPVSIDVYDSTGRHTGLINNPNPNSDLQAFEENIPGSRYMEFGEGKYVLLDDGAPYMVKLQGLDVGTFTLEANTLSSGGETLSSSEFVDIPTSPDMKGEIQVSATSTASSSVLIKIDVNGDGVNDFTVNSNTDFDPIVYLQILRKTVETFDAGAKTKNEIYKKIDTIIKTLQKNKTKSAIIKIKQFSKDFAINQKHKKDEIDKKQKGPRGDMWNNKKKKLNPTDSEIMLQMLSQLLNNLI